jgi:hypothetical protein
VYVLSQVFFQRNSSDDHRPSNCEWIIWRLLSFRYRSEAAVLPAMASLLLCGFDDEFDLRVLRVAIPVKHT